MEYKSNKVKIRTVGGTFSAIVTLIIIKTFKQIDFIHDFHRCNFSNAYIISTGVTLHSENVAEFTIFYRNKYSNIRRACAQCKECCISQQFLFK